MTPGIRDLEAQERSLQIDEDLGGITIESWLLTRKYPRLLASYCVGVVATVMALFAVANVPLAAVSVLTSPAMIAAGGIRSRMIFLPGAVVLERGLWSWRLSRRVMALETIERVVVVGRVWTALRFARTDGGLVVFSLGSRRDHEAIAAWVNERLARTAPLLVDVEMPVPQALRDLVSASVGARGPG